MSHFQSRWLASALVWAGLSGPMYAVDGVVLIDQNRALAGGVTPGDTPGFPVTLSVPGSYRLTGNLTVPDANTTAIQIAADNVTLDLNGFSILGPVVCSFNFLSTPQVSCNLTGSGVGVDAFNFPHDNLTVVNGTIRGMGSLGISNGGAFGYFEKVHAISNGTVGLSVGDEAIVTGNTASLNRISGILAFATSTVSGNTATRNGSFGIRTGCPSSVVGNTAYLSGNNLSFIGSNCVSANNAAGP